MGRPLIWHVRNGSTAHIGEYQVAIPKWVRPYSDNPLRFELRHGRYDDVEVAVGRKVTPGEKWKEDWEAKSKSTDPKVAEVAKYFLEMKTTRLMIADQPSFCIDDGFMIQCIPEHQERGLSVEFFGSLHRDAKPLFYETLGKIKRTGAK